MWLNNFYSYQNTLYVMEQFIPLYYDDDKEPDSTCNVYEASTIRESIELYRL